MGFLHKFFGGGTGADTGAARAQPPAGELVRLGGDGRVSVVGESNYQPALRAAAGGRSVTPGDFDNAIVAQAVLVPEPSNRFDGNAVRVDVGGSTVGYLSRDLAKEYQPVLLNLQREGKYGWCSARIMDGESGLYGIWLHLSPPDRVVCANLAEDLEILDADREVTVTGEEQHQGVLEKLVGPHSAVTVFASFAPCKIGRGKHAGQDGLEVHINGQRVGELTKTMSNRYAALVRALTDAGRRPGCEATVSASEKGLQVQLRMPKV